MADDQTARPVRRTIDYWPNFDEVRPWTAAVIRTNYWRVSYYMEVDDLWQEAWVVFDRLTKRYPRVNNARHFHSIYRPSLQRRIIDLTRRNSRVPLPLATAEDYSAIPEQAIDSLGPLLVMVRELAEGRGQTADYILEVLQTLGHQELPSVKDMAKLLTVAIEDLLAQPALIVR